MNEYIFSCDNLTKRYRDFAALNNFTMHIPKGAIYGFVVVWIAFYVIALCSTSEVGGALISYIYESPFLTYIYENNLIVTLIMMFL